MRKGKDAFTLIEMLVVVVVIGILAAALIPRLQWWQERARDMKRKVDINTIANALMIYKEDNGQYRSSFINYPSLLRDPYVCWDDKCTHMDGIFTIDKTYTWGVLPLNSIPKDPQPSNIIYPLSIMDFGGFDWLMLWEQTYIQWEYWYIRDQWYDNKEIVFLVAHVENLSNVNFWQQVPITSLIEFKEFTDYWWRNYDEVKPWYEAATSSDDKILCKNVTYNINPTYPPFRDMSYYIHNCQIMADSAASAKQWQYYVRILR